MKRMGVALVTLLIVVMAPPLAQAFYHPAPGRWLSRDPAEEAGGAGLFVLTRNSAIAEIDFLGLWELRCRLLSGAAGMTCQRHCWVECDGVSYSLLNNGGEGIPSRNDPRDLGLGEIVASVPSGCECIQRQFDANSAGYEYSALDCNSNYFAHKLLSCCGNRVDPPARAPGWNTCDRAAGIFNCVR